MKRASLAVALLGAVLLFAAPPARAQEPGGAYDPDAQPTDDTPPATPDTAPARSGHFVGRVGAMGAYRSLYDLSILGGGIALSLGGEGDHVGGFANVHFSDGRTTAGLVVLEGGVTGTAEWRLGDGWRAGLGGGFTYFGIQRATTGSYINSIGPTALGRFGYDFGDKQGLYVLGQLETQLQSNGSLVWGPTLELGLRF